VGEGTSVEIYLPRAAAIDQEEIPAPVPTEPRRGRETILVVEDETPLMNLVTRVLRDLGYQVLSADTAAEALRVVKEADGPLDLLLTDVVLPGEWQGPDLAHALLSSRPHLAVLYVSGYALGSLVPAGRLDERVNLLEKPFSLEALAATVRTVLDEARASR
jgi:DNA-binding NtrC family response regulator